MSCQRRYQFLFRKDRSQLQRDCNTWRDEHQLKINDLVMACQAAADDYEQAAQLFESPTLTEWLTAVAPYREHLVPLLEEQVRELNDLPRVPDPEKRLLERALTRFKAALPTRGHQQILDERIQADREMLALAKSARKEPLPKAAPSLLDELITLPLSATWPGAARRWQAKQDVGRCEAG